MYTNVAGKGRVATKELRAWRKVAYSDISSALIVHSHDINRTFIRHLSDIPPVFSGQFILTILLSEVGLTRDRDCDGAIKAVADALVTNKVVVDDNRRYMRSSTATWSDTVEEGRCLATVCEISTVALAAARTTNQARTPRKSKQAVCEAVRKKYGLSISDDRIHVN
jgi:hypothetical protein